MMTVNNDIALKVEGLRKSYGPTVALDSVSFEVPKGSVHALLGENGAGKSTFVKLLSGLVQPNDGTISVFGNPINLKTPKAAHLTGIRTAFQELTLCPDLTVVQNYLLPDQPRYPWGTLRVRENEQSVLKSLTELGITNVDPLSTVSSLDLATRQKVEIARAAHHRPSILLLDEPTASLSGPDIDWLHDVVMKLKQDGTTTLFISHRLAEVRRFCDTMTVLRNGRAVLGGSVADATDKTIIESIIGRSFAQAFPPKVSRSSEGAENIPVLEACKLATAGGVSEVSFKLMKGEIVGIAALQGMGQQELLESLFGAVQITSGTLFAHGRKLSLSSPRDALAASAGISLVPEERKTDGLFLAMDGRTNTTLPVLSRLSRLGVVDRRAELNAVRSLFKRVQVTDRAVHSPMSAFSGGNQQKVAIAKWLITENPILLMLDPTRGVDVGTKHEIYLLMQEYVAAGGAILFYSTEIEEIVHLSHRVLVMYKGKIAAELDDDRGKITEEAVMEIALGGAAAAPRQRVH